MQKLNKNGQVSAFDWQVPEADQLVDQTALQNGQWLLPAAQFAEIPDETRAQAGIGLCIRPDDDLDAIAELLAQATLVAIDFPAFTDGRGFSQARWAREKCGFKGELLAIGNFMQDQLWHLKRCGFDAFVVSEDANLESMQQSLNDFSDAYQASADQPTPLFRRRSAS